MTFFIELGVFGVVLVIWSFVDANNRLNAIIAEFNRTPQVPDDKL